MLRILVIWLLIVAAESVHGTIRRLLMEPVMGDLPARQVSVFTGTLLIFVITLLCIRWMRLRTLGGLLLAGTLWVGLTLGFEIILGLFVLGYGVDRITEDLDPLRGGLMGFGLLFMFFAPLLAARIRRIKPFAIAP